MIAPVIRLCPCLPNDLDACLGIVRGLPEFFTADALDTIRSDFGQHQGWAADNDEGSASPSWIDGRVPRRRFSGRQSTETAVVLASARS
jgi:hypothetical protein